MTCAMLPVSKIALTERVLWEERHRSCLTRQLSLFTSHNLPRFSFQTRADSRNEDELEQSPSDLALEKAADLIMRSSPSSQSRGLRSPSEPFVCRRYGWS